MTQTIGQIAREADVGVETIRFYERKGLIEEPPRSSSGYRHYPTETVRRLEFIKKAKELGFSLNEIRELLGLRAEPRKNCGHVRARAEEKIEAIDKKVASLVAMRKALEDLVQECSGTGPRTDCPILNALDAEAEKSQ